MNIQDVYHLSLKRPYHFDTSLDKRNNYRTKSLLALPLKDIKGEVVGVLQLINAQDEKGRVIPFSTEDIVRALASQAAVAINNARLLETLEKLRAAEKKRYHHHLEAIFQSVKDAIITLDLEGKILFVHDAARTICGVDPQKILGQDFPEVMKDCQKTCGEAMKNRLIRRSPYRHLWKSIAI